MHEPFLFLLTLYFVDVASCSFNDDLTEGQ